MTFAIQELMRQAERLRDGFRQAVLGGDVDAALAVCAGAVAVVHRPMRTGASGQAEVRRFLADDVVGHLPADLGFARVSRTIDRFRVVDEERVGFTHDRELPWLLPGVAPTGRRTDVLVVTICTVQQGRVAGVRALWDSATLVAELGVPADAVRPLAAGR